MKLLVTGGRDYDDRELVFAVLDRMHAQRWHKSDGITLLIHGACGLDRDRPNDPKLRLRGADRWADEWATERGVPCQRVPARWNFLGPKGGPIRNAEMVDMQPHRVLAFPGGAGTDGCVRLARARRIPVENAIELELEGRRRRIEQLEEGLRGLFVTTRNEHRVKGELRIHPRSTIATAARLVNMDLAPFVADERFEEDEDELCPHIVCTTVGETGDSIAHCSNCGEERDEPHPWRACAERLAKEVERETARAHDPAHARAHDPAHARAVLEIASAEPFPTFEQAWAKKKAEGYQYGRDALQGVHFGWEIHEAECAKYYGPKKGPEES